MNNIINYTQIILDSTCESGLPPEISEKVDHAQEKLHIVSTENLKDLLEIVLDVVESSHVLFISDNVELKNVLLSINPLHKYKIAVYCQGVYDADDVETAVERMKHTLHTADGTEYYPDAEIGQDVYSNTDGRIFCMNNCTMEKSEIIYNHNGDSCGTLLPETCTTDNCIGWLSQRLDNLSLHEKAAVCLSLLDIDNIPASDHILLFRDTDSIRVAVIPDDEIEVSAVEMVWEVFTGIQLSNYDDIRNGIIEGSTTPDLPSTLMEDMITAYHHVFYPDKANKQIDINQLLSHTLTRIMMIY